jgi:hypothetical protein
MGIYENDMHSLQEHVTRSLKPNSNLRDLQVGVHRRANYPLLLGGKLSVKNLESLRLHDIGWKISSTSKAPPMGR